MSGIPVSQIPNEHQDVLILLSENGTVSVSSLRDYTLPRAAHQIVVLEKELGLNWWNRLALERIQAKIDRLTTAANYVTGLVNPSLVGGTYGGPSRQASGANALGLTRCRFPGCTEYVGRRDRFERAGACESCWNKAYHPNNDQIGDHS